MPCSRDNVNYLILDKWLADSHMLHQNDWQLVCGTSVTISSKWETVKVHVLLVRQTSKLSCADGMTWRELWDKATNSVLLYKWAESGILELCFCILGSFELGRSKSVFPFDTIMQSHGISLLHTEPWITVAQDSSTMREIASPVFNIYFKNGCLPSHQVRIK